MDPRFKTEWISYTHLNEGDVLSCVQTELVYRFRKIQDDTHDIRDADLTAATTDLRSSNGEDVTSEGNQPTAKRALPTRQLYSTFKRASRPASAGSAKLLDEFETYLSDPIAPMESEEVPGKSNPGPFRPLKYWLNNIHRFPYLSLIARDILGTPASSGSVKRCFSTALDIIGIKRGNLKADIFNQLLFIKRNHNLV